MASNFVSLGPSRQNRWMSLALVEDYKSAHEEMLAAISAMDELTSNPAPNSLRLSHTRLRLTRACTQYRSKFRMITAILSRDSTPATARVIEALEGRHLELKELTTMHLATWTQSEIHSNWEGFCRSSEEVRRRWREIIERERQLLYPLL